MRIRLAITLAIGLAFGGAEAANAQTTDPRNFPPM
jgi:hypothetical protein